MGATVAVPIIIVALLLGLVGGFFVCVFFTKSKKKTAIDFYNQQISKAQVERKNILQDTKESILKERQTFEKEKIDTQASIKVEREVMKQEKVLHEQRALEITKKEQTLDKKEDVLDKKINDIEEQKQRLTEQKQNIEEEQKQKAIAFDETVKERQKELDEIQNSLNKQHEKMLEALQKAAELSKEDAKEQLILEIEDEAKRDAIKLVRDIEQNAKEDADKKARDIVATAIQRCSVDHSSDAVISVVSLPNDEMKGRIIGREGRNVRALEAATGVDFIIDDTPETIVLSGFDPVRREIARLSLEKLMSDGRFHPTRIEEIVEKTKKEIDQKIKESGEQAMFEVGLYGLHPELIKIVGRLKYRTSYGQNILSHSIEVALIAGIMAAELGADVEVSKRGAFLHDIGKAVDHETEGTHVSIGVDLLKKYKESDAVIHCVQAHHFDVEPSTIEAIIVQASDCISGGRPGARREQLNNYIKRLEQLENIANDVKGVDKAFAVQAGREIRIIVKPEQIDDIAMTFMAKDVAKTIEAQMQYPGQIKVNVIRETRSVEYAK